MASYATVHTSGEISAHRSLHFFYNPRSPFRSRSLDFRLATLQHYFAPCRLDFDTLLSSIINLIPQPPLPSRPHSWLPSVQTILTLTWLPYTSFLPASTIHPHHSSLLLYNSYNMPIQLHYIQLYRSCYPRRRYDVMLGLHHNAVT